VPPRRNSSPPQGRITEWGEINPDEFTFWAVQDRTVAGRRVSLDIPPLRGYCYVIDPGAECEPAVFGLCRYPSTITLEDGTRLRTRLSGWRLHTCCKTQYADIRGWDHFLACHRLVISAALVWKRLGCQVKITDEGHYGPGRRVKTLRENLATYYRLIAGLGGAFKDATADTECTVEAPIFDHTHFERLEAEASSLARPPLSQ
jgi:hypothetical protein